MENRAARGNPQEKLWFWDIQTDQKSTPIGSWGLSWPVLVLSWLVLACHEPVLALSWPVLGLSGPVLGLSWPCLGPVLACLGPSWARLGLPWAPLGPVLVCLGPVLGRFWTPCYNCCKKSLLTFTFCFSLLSCSAAVRAQHMELEPSWPFWPQNLIGGARLNDLKLDVF